MRRNHVIVLTMKRSPTFTPASSYNQNLWMHHLTEGATYLPL
jgi:hypothetical protein